MQIPYLEIVTTDVDGTCATLSQIHGATFCSGVAALGGARTAKMTDGARIGVRAPMSDVEEPIVRPYVRVDDIAAEVAAAAQSGAEILHPPMELPGEGTFAIYMRGGVQHGLWQD